MYGDGPSHASNSISDCECISPKELKKRLHRSARAELEEQLLENECPVILIEGVSAQAMIVTNQQRVLVFKKGMMSGIAFGRKTYIWHFDQIRGVRVDVRLVNGIVALETANSSVDDISYWSFGDKDKDAWQAANAIAIDKFVQKQAREGATKLRQMLHHYHTPPHRVATRPDPIPGAFGPLADQVDTAGGYSAADATPDHGEPQYCFACGAKLHSGAAFCSSCGRRVR